MKTAAIIQTLVWTVGLASAGNFAEMEMNFGRQLLVPRATTTNLQTFTGALGGAVADPITSSGDASRPFQVGTSTFTDFKSAATRSCNNQHNNCSDIANNKAENTSGITTTQCDTQQTACIAASTSATQTTFASASLTTSDAEFDFFCEPA